jgi:XTP/dITP diphosphohydrolase
MEKKMDIVLSTRNPSKAEQIKAVFAGVPINVLTLSDVGIEGEAVEDGTTLEENAMKKALFAHRPGTWSMADDTGLFIPALGGRPGVYAARWAGETATTDEITQHTLKQLEGVEDRTATFKTVVALVMPKGEIGFFSGEVHGRLLEAPRVKPQPKMPYSPLFIPDGSDKVWAEMTPDEENTISHRGKAFRFVREYLLELI